MTMVTDFHDGLAPSATPTVPLPIERGISRQASDIAAARAAILCFASKMTDAGVVTVSSPLVPGLVEHRLAVLDSESPGFTVHFISATDGEPEVTTMNFDFSDARALRHVVHPNKSVLTLFDAQNRPVVQYRIG